MGEPLDVLRGDGALYRGAAMDKSQDQTRVRRALSYASITLAVVLIPGGLIACSLYSLWRRKWAK